MPATVAVILMIFLGLLVISYIELMWRLEHLHEERSKRYRWKLVTQESLEEKDHVER